MASVNARQLRQETRPEAPSPPYGLEAERAVLGTLLLEPSAFDPVRELIDTGDFYSEGNARIYQTMLDLHRLGTPVDTVTVREALARSNKLQSAGGDDYLLSLTDTIPTVENAAAHARIIRQHALSRAVLEAGQRLARAGQAGDLAGAQTHAREALGALLEVAELRKAPAYHRLGEMVAECMRPVGRRLTTGIPALDQATRGGLPLARLVAILGAPGSGKSTFCAQIADVLERQGCAVVYLAADEPAEGIAIRFGQLAGFSREALEADDDAGSATRSLFARRCADRRIAIIDPDADGSARTIEDAARALEHLAEGRPRVLIVDSLQTAQCAAAEQLESQRERIDAKLSVLKAIAKRGVLVIEVSEMARGGYRTGDKSADTSALAAGKESGSIEYGASLLLGMRSVKGEHGLVDVEVAKNRLGGHKPEFRLVLNFDRASFSEVDMPDIDEQRDRVEDVKATRARERVIDAVKRRELKSKDQLCLEAGGRRADTWRAATRMMLDGELLQVAGVFRLQLGGTNG